MKKILLASTALVTLAGAAAAEVAISGSGRLGMVYDKSIVNDDFVLVDGTLERASDAGFRFSSRVRVAFTLTQETDAGVTFGGSVRADNAADGNQGKAGTVFLSGNFGKISMGDVDGAAESAVGDLSGVGYTNLNDLNEAFYLQAGNEDLEGNEAVTAFALPAALYEFSTGGVNLFVSLGNPGGIEVPADVFNIEDEDNERFGDFIVSDVVLDSSFSLGASYTVDNYSFGIGYESLDVSGVVTTPGEDGEFDEDADGDDTSTEYSNNVDHFILGGSATFGGFTLKAQYGEAQGDELDLTQYGISGDYTFDAFTVTAFWRNVELKTVDDVQSVESAPFGLGVAYDLGGGAAIKAGVVDPDVLGEDYRADVGVTFSF